ncbi:hypothetical protein Vretimale_13187 [Volvox reticuliferus]|uniref:Rit1 N-terminal domain-containing protein n=2 Tax=Volvox reticuliferus TaxID=1737510 RepID=A0A8J4LTB7_9CHLO|nr:hypothetical protein Vretimale_13187 [Volvox reticuliferus]
MADDADGFLPPTQESIWKVTRQLKKEQSSLYNCVASVLSDAAFVSEVRALYPALPLLANLRCGLWYTRQADGTCYFKSTDGHNGNWSFSCTRLNWHVCELAAKQGGVIIVDATRKGKRFPDAMTKTIPIWAAVVNRAVARKRVEAAARLVASERAATEGPLPSIKPQNERDDASRHDSTLSVGPSPSRAMQQNGSVVSGTVLPQPFHSPWAACSAIDYDTSGAGGGVGSLSQWLQSPVAAAARADDSESYPAFLYPAPFSGSFTVQTPLQCPAGGDVGSSNAALPAAAELSGCRVAGAVDASGSCEGAVDPGNPCDTDLSIMEIFGEVSFGDISDAGEAALPDRDWCQLQTLMAGCEHEKHVLEADGALCGSAQSDSLAGAAEPMAAPAECLADPRDRTFFAVACPASAALPATPEVVGLSTSTTEIASRSAVDDVVEVQAALAELAKAPSAADVVVELPAMIPEVAAHPLGDDVVRLPAASPPAAGGGGCSAGALAPALPVECMDSVDLGAASASHVSCSPEEGWRWGCRFGGIVEDGGLRLHCDCGTWKCTAGGPIGNSELDHIYKLNRSSDNDFRHLKAYQHTGGKIQVKVQAQMQAQSLIDENVPVKQPGVSSPPQRQGCQQRHHHQQGPFPSHQRRQNLQLDSDLDADGSGGSCSDTCSPAALSGLASTRSTSSSSSSLSASRSSSCSSGHSDGAARVGVKATATSGGGSRIVRACIGVEPFIPQCQPFPRHYTYSASSPSHLLAGKARRCGSLPPRPGAISCGVGNGNRLSSSGGGSSCSSRSTGSASCSAPSSNTCSNTSSSSNSRNSSVGGGVPAVDVCASAHDGAGADGGDGWDVGLHLPLWVSSNERAQIERRLDGWVDALLRVGADVEGLSAVRTGQWAGCKADHSCLSL